MTKYEIEETVLVDTFKEESLSPHVTIRDNAILDHNGIEGPIAPTLWCKGNMRRHKRYPLPFQ